MQIFKKTSKLVYGLIFGVIFSVAFTGCRDAGYKYDRGLFIIAIDGVRPDIIAQTDTPTIDRLKEEGVYNMAARATVPTQTRVNFVTIPTGVHADKHGVVGSAYMNERWQYRSTDYPDYRGAQRNVPVPTIFEVIEREQGLKTGYIATKGYELVGGRGAGHQVKVADYIRPEVWDNRYEKEVDGSEEKALQLKKELDEVAYELMVEAVRDNGVEMFIANLAALDYVGHQHGVEPEFTDAYQRTLKKADAHLGNFLEFLEDGNYFKELTVIFTSDHGFTQILTPKNIILDSGRGEPDIPKLGEAGIEHAGMSRGGSAFSLFIRDEDRVEEAYNTVKSKEWVENIYSEHDLPGLTGTLSDLNYYNPPRTGDFFIDVMPTHTVVFESHGQHGSSTDRDLLIPHIFAGTGINLDATLENSENVDIAPTALTVLGINPDEHLKAQGRVLEEILID